ncbi:hypothetical protein SCARD494_01864 [Seiridium cardinale]
MYQVTRLATGGIIIEARKKFYQLTTLFITKLVDDDAYHAADTSVLTNARGESPQPPHTDLDSTAEYGTHKMTRIGNVAYRSLEGDDPSLSYALVELRPSETTKVLNEIIVGEGLERKIVHVTEAFVIEDEKRDIVVITSSNGRIYGKLWPGRCDYRIVGTRAPWTTYAIVLDGPIREGDGGSAVIDLASGKLCGHVIRGLANRRIAYIIPATDMLEHVRANFDSKAAIASISPSDMSKPTGVGGIPQEDNAPSVPIRLAMRNRDDFDFAALDYSNLDGGINVLICDFFPSSPRILPCFSDNLKEQ